MPSRLRVYHLPAICCSLALVHGCSSAAVPRPPPRAEKVRHFSIPVPPIFVDSNPTLEWTIPVLNDTSELLQFTQVRQGCACVGVAKLDEMHLRAGQQT